MAEVTLPGSRTGAAWLDRPITPSWQRLAALAAHWEVIAYGTLLVLGFVLRIWDVGGRAMHHDESLHAYYAWKLFVGQGYTYDPLMHGPLQFEVVPLFYLLFGANEFSARLLAVLLGTVLIALPYFLRHHLTRPGALLAAVMITISPSLVYYSRFIRDDTYLACFTLLLFIAIIRYLETHQPRYLYIAAAAIALAVASMEAAYITIFIFGTFLIFLALHEFLSSRDGPVLSAVKATSFDTWLTALSILVVITVVLYSTFFTNPYGIWDSRFGFHDLLNSQRKDILGGLTYWKAQHSVQRGGQPWFYYLLVIPLYEQLAVVFGIAGIVYAAARRSLVTTFLVWWAVLSLIVYSWAGEKMPWLSIHITLPFILLAGLFLGKVLSFPRRWALIVTGAVFALLLVLEVHSTFALNFQDPANPTEMLIYVQTSQDVPNVVGEVSALSRRLTGGNNMQIGLDNADVGGWPFIWYLRDFPNVTETSSFSGKVCGGQYCPVLLMLGPEYDQYASSLSKHYVVQRYRWNWWFPEDYKVWFPEHVGTIPLALTGQDSLATDPIGTMSDWNNLWNWLVYRRPFGDRGARLLYMLVRRDLVPGSKYFKASPGTTSTAPPASTGIAVPSITASLRTASGGSPLSGPRGIAAGRNGNLYVADTLNHRVVEYSAAGRFIRAWGTVGTGTGQFSHQDSPQSLGVAPNGEVYVVDTWNQRVEVFTSDGRFLRQWGGGPIGSAPGQFYGPRAIAISRTGRVYVADTGNKRIQVFDTTGKFLSTWGTAGTGPGQFQEPSAVTVAPDGHVYVADFWNQRIQEFSAGGSFVRSWSVTDWPPQSYDEPYLTVDAKTGDIMATDPAQHRVLVWSATGKVIGALGAGQLTLPVGVAALPNGAAAVTDATTNGVDIFTLSPSPASKGKRP